MTDKQNANNYIMNIKLAVYTGLYQMINPGSPKLFGYNAYHVIVIIYVAFIIVLLVMLSVGVFCYWINDTQQFVMGLLQLVNYCFACVKVFTIILYSKKIWQCIEVTRVDFLTSCKMYDSTLLNKCLLRSFRITNVYSLFCYTLMVSWYIAPFVLRNSHMAIKQRDGTYWKYRHNVHNLYLPISAETYNEYFTQIYIMECVFGFSFIEFTVIFDIFIISMCLAISSQIETINNALMLVGHEHEQMTTNGE